MILWLACGTPDPDTDETDTPVPERRADAVISGTAAGWPLALAAGDVTGDGQDDLVAGSGDETCVFAGPLSDRAWDDGACWTGETAADQAGFAVTTGDGRIGVGAPLAAGGGFQRGRVYLVPGDGGSLSGAPFSASGASDLDGFGTALVLLDGTGDGATDLVVGAPGNDQGGAGAGQVYLFAGPIADGAVSASDATISITGTASSLRHASGEGGDSLGYAMTAPGDLDGDGLGDLVLAAGGHDDPATDAGIALVFLAPMRAGHYGILAADIQFPGLVENGWLGEPSAGSDDLDGDGYRELLLGSPGQALGHLYRYDGPFRPLLPPAGPVGAWVGAAPFDGIGASFLLPGDVDGDGAADALVAAATGPGIVGLFLGPLPDGDLTMADADRTWAGEDADRLGAGLAAGEFDGAPGRDLAMGAPDAADESILRVFFGD